MSAKVLLSRLAQKQIRKLPVRIQASLFRWIDSIEFIGIRATRLRPGYHDKPLSGRRFGQRSVRLNNAYRVFYVEQLQDLEILIIEVNKHEY